MDLHLKPPIFLYLLIPVMLLSACVAPVNSAFESAKMLKKGEVEVQGNSSAYLNTEPHVYDLQNVNNNFGAAITVGVSEKYNAKLRYEALVLTTNQYQVLDTSFTIPRVFNYVELGNKISLVKDKLAINIPLGFYIVGEGVTMLLKPRLLITISNSQYFELNIIPRAHIGITDDLTVFPSLNIGLGLSKDLNKWAFRPEVGWDGHFTAGIGFSYFIKRKT